jgi:hypothetical protein
VTVELLSLGAKKQWSGDSKSLSVSTRIAAERTPPCICYSTIFYQGSQVKIWAHSGCGKSGKHIQRSPRKLYGTANERQEMDIKKTNKITVYIIVGNARGKGDK